MLCAVTLTRTSCSHTRAVLVEKCLNQDGAGVDQSVFSFPVDHGHLVFSTNSPLLHIPLPVLLLCSCWDVLAQFRACSCWEVGTGEAQDRSQVCDG